jgi:hypothetical protein
MSNPNPQSGVSKYSKLSQQDIIAINKKQGLTFPFVSGLYRNGELSKFGKKVCFEEMQT